MVRWFLNLLIDHYLDSRFNREEILEIKDLLEKLIKGQENQNNRSINIETNFKNLNENLKILIEEIKKKNTTPIEENKGSNKEAKNEFMKSYNDAINKQNEMNENISNK